MSPPWHPHLVATCTEQSDLLLDAHLGVQCHGQGSSQFFTLDVSRMLPCHCISDL